MAPRVRVTQSVSLSPKTEQPRLRPAPPAVLPQAHVHFLVVDVRFGTPIYVFLEDDPQGQGGNSELTVQEVTLETASGGSAMSRCAIGRDPKNLMRFREFASDGAVAHAGFILVEPRYVGPTWEGYCRNFRPEGEKPAKRLDSTWRSTRVER